MKKMSEVEGLLFFDRSRISLRGAKLEWLQENCRCFVGQKRRFTDFNNFKN